MRYFPWIIGLVLELCNGCATQATLPSVANGVFIDNPTPPQEEEYWTPDRMNDAKPMPLPHGSISDESNDESISEKDERKKQEATPSHPGSEPISPQEEK
ncbi:MAG: hypothetical protein NPIRA02_06440 [Nitrospirales bacterium]|nr:MAG: hypothetical protein NPIRA02_06440 [Nitrospirales bacterium]